MTLVSDRRLHFCPNPAILRGHYFVTCRNHYHARTTVSSCAANQRVDASHNEDE